MKSEYINEEDITLIDEYNNAINGKYLMTFTNEDTNKTYLFYKKDNDEKVYVAELVDLENINTSLTEEELNLLDKIYSVVEGENK